jgi:hypothetical protein
LRQFYRDPATLALLLGIFLTGFGSSYYHWNPNNDTLFWDRLPMTLCFMAILAIVVEERVNARFGAVLLWPPSSNRPIQSYAMALDRGSSALRLGAILSCGRCASPTPAIPTQIYWDFPLDHRRVPVRRREIV